MKKGITGVNLAFFAVAAFLLAIANQTLLAWLLVGFALIVEKDQWLSEQTMTAAMLSLMVNVVNAITSEFFNLLTSFIRQDALGAIRAIQITERVIEQLVFWLVLILSFVCIGMISGGKGAEIPGISSMVRKALGIMPVYQQPVYPQQQATPQMQPQQAAPQMQPQQAAPQMQPQQTAPQMQPQQAAPQMQPQQAAPQMQPQQAAPQIQPQQATPQMQPQQVAPQETHPSHCPFCGAKVGEQERFCMKCGKRLSE